MRDHYFNEDLQFYANEVVRCYNVLDADLAEIQNKDDIKEWWLNHLISDSQYSRLVEYNKDLYYEFVN